MELKDRVALVTGAGAGIGRASALRLAAAGAMLGVLDRDPDRVAEVCGEIEAAGGRAVPLVADVTDLASMRAAVTTLHATGGRLDVVFANAGINGVWAPIDELQPHEWSQTIAVNLTGTYHTLHVAVPLLEASGGGSIVITSSINGTRTFTTAGASVYSATKAAQLALAQQLAVELARHRIRVNAICPGQTITSIGESTFRRNQDRARVPVLFPEGDIPLGGKPALAEDIADLVLFLASDRSRHITGTPIWIDGGQGLLR